MKSTTSIMRKLTFVAAAFAAMTLLASSAMAACPKGYLCFWDLDGNKGPKNAWFKVQYNNKNWAKFGWDNRADKFLNNGRYQHVCVYSGIKYGGYLKRLIHKGYSYKAGWLMKNRVSSNKWTYRTRC